MDSSRTLCSPICDLKVCYFFQLFLFARPLFVISDVTISVPMDLNVLQFGLLIVTVLCMALCSAIQ
jgi:hypothetical protein